MHPLSRNDQAFQRLLVEAESIGVEGADAAEHLGLHGERAALLQRAFPVSLDAAVSPDIESGLLEVLADPNADDPSALAEANDEAVRVVALVKRLPERMQIVLRRLIRDGATLGQVASELGVSESRVSQIRRRALELLRAEFTRQESATPRKVVPMPWNDEPRHDLVKAPAQGTWIDGAVTRLRQLLAELAKVDALRDEAERTQAALIAFGAANVPELPWKNPKVKHTSTGSPRNWGACVRCGHVFHGTYGRRAGPNGPQCADAEECTKRKEKRDFGLQASA
jgi:RNA polymerase sigma factor (sigma-70 family)